MDRIGLYLAQVAFLHDLRVMGSFAMPIRRLNPFPDALGLAPKRRFNLSALSTESLPQSAHVFKSW